MSRRRPAAVPRRRLPPGPAQGRRQRNSHHTWTARIADIYYISVKISFAILLLCIMSIICTLFNSVTIVLYCDSCLHDVVLTFSGICPVNVLMLRIHGTY